MRVLVSGATGFIGGAVLRHLDTNPVFEALGSSRRATSTPTYRHRLVTVGPLDADTDWRQALDRVDAVVHTAARVHVMNDAGDDALDTYRAINVAGTLRLAQQAIDAGAKRFVFLSSIKVNGELTAPGSAFHATDAPAPVDAYGISKLEAEQELSRLCETAPMDLVTIRPTLVYGPGVKANFESLMRFLHKGLPLPLAAIHNKRSMTGIDNLVSLIELCLVSDAAANRVFLASDGEDLSTTELLRRTASALNCRARLFFVPSSVIRLGARLAGRDRYARRLLDSLQVDIADTREILNWSPPCTVDEGLQKAAVHFLGNAG